MWEADPLLARRENAHRGPLIDERGVIDRILRHLGLWEEGCVSTPTPSLPPKRSSSIWFDDPSRITRRLFRIDFLLLISLHSFYENAALASHTRRNTAEGDKQFPVDIRP